MSSICEQGDPYNGRIYHYLIGVFDGIDHVTISAGILIIRKSLLVRRQSIFIAPRGWSRSSLAA
jgi:hypothetical protein